MILYVKNMVCDRCVMTVRQIVASSGMTDAKVEMGKVTFAGELSPEKIAEIGQKLGDVGFELLKNPEDVLVERVKNAVIELVRSDDVGQENLSERLAAATGTDYRQLSAVFSAHERRTVEKFYIAQKVERVKELIDYGELTVSEIAYCTGYSSVAHLSRQFKQVTGVTPTQYKAMNQVRKPLDKV